MVYQLTPTHTALAPHALSSIETPTVPAYFSLQPFIAGTFPRDVPAEASRIPGQMLDDAQRAERPAIFSGLSDRCGGYAGTRGKAPG